MCARVYFSMRRFLSSNGCPGYDWSSRSGGGTAINAALAQGYLVMLPAQPVLAKNLLELGVVRSGGAVQVSLRCVCDVLRAVAFAFVAIPTAVFTESTRELQSRSLQEFLRSVLGKDACRL